MRPWYKYDEPPRQFRFGFGGNRLVYILIGITAGAFLLELVGLKVWGPGVIFWFGFYGPNFVRGAVWQPVTYMFLHDPNDLWHLLLNMLGLYFFGPAVANALGRRSFLMMYFACGIVGAGLELAFAFRAPTIGASGGVLGVVMAFAIINPNARIILFPIPIPIRAIWIAIFYAFITVAGILASAGGGIAHWVHFGGLVVGFLWARYRYLGDTLSRWWGVRMDRAQARRQTRQAQRTAAEQAEMDRILAKVHQSGITSLSNAERDFLNRMSRKFKDR